MIFYAHTEVLFLSSNSFSGSIPQTIGRAKIALKGLYLSDNSLNGPIPEGICVLQELSKFIVEFPCSTHNHTCLTPY